MKVRIDELRSAIATLSTLPHAVVYVDAGAADAHDRGFMARMLRWVGVERIQGFFTNSTHQDWTRKEIRYARWLVRKLGGGPHYVVNTAANGQRAADPEEPRQARQLVPLQRPRAAGSARDRPPTSRRSTATSTGSSGSATPAARPADARTPPSAPPTGAFWLDYALELIRNADFRIT